MSGVHHDSRAIAPGDIFVCVRGLRSDGHDHAPRALEAGAALVVGEREAIAAPGPYLQVADSRKALALLSCALHDHPSRSMLLTGVTGTNGKTSVTCMLDAIYREAGLRSAVLGTLGSGVTAGMDVGGQAASDRAASTRAASVGSTDPLGFRSGEHTTPEASDLQAELARWRDGGIEAGAMEVSSHGLALRRSYGTRFACVVFTNLSPDHLDFHGTMEAYSAAKSLLFRHEERGPEEAPSRAAIHAGDPACAAMIEGSSDEILTFGRGEGARVRPVRLETTPSGIRMRVAFPSTPAGAPSGEVEVVSPLIGSFQVDNLLAAFAAALQLGLDPEVIARGLGKLAGVPGRMERADRGSEVPVLVDYAHTPDALSRALEGLRPFTAGRLILVFGCGGDRDRAKRPLMGEAAARGADEIFVTDDNPRTEDPAAIRAEILRGVMSASSRGEPASSPGEAASSRGGGLGDRCHELGDRCHELGDREAAIAAALESARSGDLVLVAGKGHERVQIRGTESVPFDDREVVRRLLERGGSSR